MRLQAHGRFEVVGLFEPEGGQLWEYDREDAPWLLSEPLKGHYARLGTKWVVLYRWQGEMRLRIGGRDVPLKDVQRVDRVRHGTTVALEVADLETTEELSYSVDLPSREDFTPFAEAEHFDFGLFVANVAGDPKRADRMYRDS